MSWHEWLTTRPFMHESALVVLCLYSANGDRSANLTRFRRKESTLPQAGEGAGLVATADVVIRGI